MLECEDEGGKSSGDRFFVFDLRTHGRVALMRVLGSSCCKEVNLYLLFEKEREGEKEMGLRTRGSGWKREWLGFFSWVLLGFVIGVLLYLVEFEMALAG